MKRSKKAILALILAASAIIGVKTVKNYNVIREEKLLYFKNVPQLAPEVVYSSSEAYKLVSQPLNNRIVYVYGEINGDNGPDVAARIQELGDSSEPMYILLNSPGGSIFVGSQIVSAMEGAKGPVNTVCVQFCASMAAMIHQYGTTRYMLNKSVLLFHPASGGVNPGEMDKMYSELNFFKRFIGKMEENAANRAKLPLSIYKYESATELIIDSEDAFKRHFTDKVSYVRGSDTSKLFHQESSSETAYKKKINSSKLNTSFLNEDVMWE